MVAKKWWCQIELLQYMALHHDGLVSNPPSPITPDPMNCAGKSPDLTMTQTDKASENNSSDQSVEATIYHNPACGTSRKVLALLQERGIEPTVIEYLKTPPSREQLQDLLTQAGLSARAVIREKEALYQELDLGNPERSDADLFDAMLAHPILMNRPIVKTRHGVRLCRPAELVEEILA